jgi:hypothetical protein
MYKVGVREMEERKSDMARVLSSRRMIQWSGQGKENRQVELQLNKLKSIERS